MSGIPSRFKILCDFTKRQGRLVSRRCSSADREGQRQQHIPARGQKSCSPHARTTSPPLVYHRQTVGMHSSADSVQQDQTAFSHGVPGTTLDGKPTEKPTSQLSTSSIQHFDVRETSDLLSQLRPFSGVAEENTATKSKWSGAIHSNETDQFRFLQQDLSIHTSVVKEKISSCKIQTHKEPGEIVHVNSTSLTTNPEGHCSGIAREARSKIYPLLFSDLQICSNSSTNQESSSINDKSTENNKLPFDMPGQQSYETSNLDYSMNLIKSHEHNPSISITNKNDSVMSNKLENELNTFLEDGGKEVVTKYPSLTVYNCQDKGIILCQNQKRDIAETSHKVSTLHPVHQDYMCVDISQKTDTDFLKNNLRKDSSMTKIPSIPSSKHLWEELTTSIPLTNSQFSANRVLNLNRNKELIQIHSVDKSAAITDNNCSVCHCKEISKENLISLNNSLDIQMDPHNNEANQKGLIDFIQEIRAQESNYIKEINKNDTNSAQIGLPEKHPDTVLSLNIQTFQAPNVQGCVQISQNIRSATILSQGSQNCCPNVENVNCRPLDNQSSSTHFPSGMTNSEQRKCFNSVNKQNTLVAPLINQIFSEHFSECPNRKHESENYIPIDQNHSQGTKNVYEQVCSQKPYSQRHHSCQVVHENRSAMGHCQLGYAEKDDCKFTLTNHSSYSVKEEYSCLSKEEQNAPCTILAQTPTLNELSTNIRRPSKNVSHPEDGVSSSNVCCNSIQNSRVSKQNTGFQPIEPTLLLSKLSQQTVSVDQCLAYNKTEELVGESVAQLNWHKYNQKEASLDCLEDYKIEEKKFFDCIDTVYNLDKSDKHMDNAQVQFEYPMCKRVNRLINKIEVHDRKTLCNCTQNVNDHKTCMTKSKSVPFLTDFIYFRFTSNKKQEKHSKTKLLKKPNSCPIFYSARKQNKGTKTQESSQKEDVLVTVWEKMRVTDKSPHKDKKFNIFQPSTWFKFFSKVDTVNGPCTTDNNLHFSSLTLPEDDKLNEEHVLNKSNLNQLRKPEKLWVNSEYVKEKKEVLQHETANIIMHSTPESKNINSSGSCKENCHSELCQSLEFFSLEKLGPCFDQHTHTSEDIQLHEMELTPQPHNTTKNENNSLPKRTASSQCLFASTGHLQSKNLCECCCLPYARLQPNTSKFLEGIFHDDHHFKVEHRHNFSTSAKMASESENNAEESKNIYSYQIEENLQTSRANNLNNQKVANSTNYTSQPSNFPTPIKKREFKIPMRIVYAESGMDVNHQDNKEAIALPPEKLPEVTIRPSLNKNSRSAIRELQNRIAIYGRTKTHFKIKSTMFQSQNMEIGLKKTSNMDPNYNQQRKFSTGPSFRLEKIPNAPQDLKPRKHKRIETNEKNSNFLTKKSNIARPNDLVQTGTKTVRSENFHRSQSKSKLCSSMHPNIEPVKQSFGNQIKPNDKASTESGITSRTMKAKIKSQGTIKKKYYSSNKLGTNSDSTVIKTTITQSQKSFVSGTSEISSKPKASNTQLHNASVQRKSSLVIVSSLKNRNKYPPKATSAPKKSEIQNKSQRSVRFNVISRMSNPTEVEILKVPCKYNTDSTEGNLNIARGKTSEKRISERRYTPEAVSAPDTFTETGSVIDLLQKPEKQPKVEDLATKQAKKSSKIITKLTNEHVPKLKTDRIAHRKEVKNSSLKVTKFPFTGTSPTICQTNNALARNTKRNFSSQADFRLEKIPNTPKDMPRKYSITHANSKSVFNSIKFPKKQKSTESTNVKKPKKLYTKVSKLLAGTDSDNSKQTYISKPQSEISEQFLGNLIKNNKKLDTKSEDEPQNSFLIPSQLKTKQPKYTNVATFPKKQSFLAMMSKMVTPTEVEVQLPQDFNQKSIHIIKNLIKSTHSFVEKVPSRQRSLNAIEIIKKRQEELAEPTMKQRFSQPGLSTGKSLLAPRTVVQQNASKREVVIPLLSKSNTKSTCWYKKPISMERLVGLPKAKTTDPQHTNLNIPAGMAELIEKKNVELEGIKSTIMQQQRTTFDDNHEVRFMNNITETGPKLNVSKRYMITSHGIGTSETKKVEERGARGPNANEWPSSNTLRAQTRLLQNMIKPNTRDQTRTFVTLPPIIGRNKSGKLEEDKKITPTRKLPNTLKKIDKKFILKSRRSLTSSENIINETKNALKAKLIEPSSTSKTALLTKSENTKTMAEKLSTLKTCATGPTRKKDSPVLDMISTLRSGGSITATGTINIALSDVVVNKCIPEKSSKFDTNKHAQVFKYQFPQPTTRNIGLQRNVNVCNSATQSDGLVKASPANVNKVTSSNGLNGESFKPISSANLNLAQKNTKNISEDENNYMHKPGKKSSVSVNSKQNNNVLLYKNPNIKGDKIKAISNISPSPIIISKASRNSNTGNNVNKTIVNVNPPSAFGHKFSCNQNSNISKNQYNTMENEKIQQSNLKKLPSKQNSAVRYDKSKTLVQIYPPNESGNEANKNKKVKNERPIMVDTKKLDPSVNKSLENKSSNIFINKSQSFPSLKLTQVSINNSEKISHTSFHKLKPSVSTKLLNELAKKILLDKTKTCSATNVKSRPKTRYTPETNDTSYSNEGSVLKKDESNKSQNKTYVNKSSLDKKEQICSNKTSSLSPTSQHQKINRNLPEKSTSMSTGNKLTSLKVQLRSNNKYTYNQNTPEELTKSIRVQENTHKPLSDQSWEVFTKNSRTDISTKMPPSNNKCNYNNNTPTYMDDLKKQIKLQENNHKQLSNQSWKVSSRNLKMKMNTGITLEKNTKELFNKPNHSPAKCLYGREKEHSDSSKLLLNANNQEKNKRSSNYEADHLQCNIATISKPIKSARKKVVKGVFASATLDQGNMSQTSKEKTLKNSQILFENPNETGHFKNNKIITPEVNKSTPELKLQTNQEILNNCSIARKDSKLDVDGKSKLEKMSDNVQEILNKTDMRQVAEAKNEKISRQINATGEDSLYINEKSQDKIFLRNIDENNDTLKDNKNASTNVEPMGFCHIETNDSVEFSNNPDVTLNVKNLIDTNVSRKETETKQTIQDLQKNSEIIDSQNYEQNFKGTDRGTPAECQYMQNFMGDCYYAENSIPTNTENQQNSTVSRYGEKFLSVEDKVHSEQCSENNNLTGHQMENTNSKYGDAILEVDKEAFTNQRHPEAKENNHFGVNRSSDISSRKVSYSSGDVQQVSGEVEKSLEHVQKSNFQRISERRTIYKKPPPKLRTQDKFSTGVHSKPYPIKTSTTGNERKLKFAREGGILGSNKKHPNEGKPSSLQENTEDEDGNKLPKHVRQNIRFDKKSKETSPPTVIYLPPPQKHIPTLKGSGHAVYRVNKPLVRYQSNWVPNLNLPVHHEQNQAKSTKEASLKELFMPSRRKKPPSSLTTNTAKENQSSTFCDCMFDMSDNSLEKRSWIPPKMIKPPLKLSVLKNVSPHFLNSNRKIPNKCKYNVKNTSIRNQIRQYEERKCEQKCSNEKQCFSQSCVPDTSKSKIPNIMLVKNSMSGRCWKPLKRSIAPPKMLPKTTIQRSLKNSTYYKSSLIPRVKRTICNNNIKRLPKHYPPQRISYKFKQSEETFSKKNVKREITVSKAPVKSTRTTPSNLTKTIANQPFFKSSTKKNINENTKLKNIVVPFTSRKNNLTKPSRSCDGVNWSGSNLLKLLPSVQKRSSHSAPTHNCNIQTRSVANLVRYRSKIQAQPFKRSSHKISAHTPDFIVKFHCIKPILPTKKYVPSSTSDVRKFGVKQPLYAKRIRYVVSKNPPCEDDDDTCDTARPMRNVNRENQESCRMKKVCSGWPQDYCQPRFPIPVPEIIRHDCSRKPPKPKPKSCALFKLPGCRPRARMDCSKELPENVCIKILPPVPSFSECIRALPKKPAPTECRITEKIKHLQPRNPFFENKRDFVLQPPDPGPRIDPSLAECCILDGDSYMDCNKPCSSPALPKSTTKKPPSHVKAPSSSYKKPSQEMICPVRDNSSRKPSSSSTCKIVATRPSTRPSTPSSFPGGGNGPSCHDLLMFLQSWFPFLKFQSPCSGPMSSADGNETSKSLVRASSSAASCQFSESNDNYAEEMTPRNTTAHSSAKKQKIPECLFNDQKIRLPGCKPANVINCKDPPPKPRTPCIKVEAPIPSFSECNKRPFPPLPMSECLVTKQLVKIQKELREKNKRVTLDNIEYLKCKKKGKKRALSSESQGNSSTQKNCNDQGMSTAPSNSKFNKLDGKRSSTSRFYHKDCSKNEYKEKSHNIPFVGTENDHDHSFDPLHEMFFYCDLKTRHKNDKQYLKDKVDLDMIENMSRPSMDCVKRGTAWSKFMCEKYNSGRDIEQSQSLAWLTAKRKFSSTPVGKGLQPQNNANLNLPDSSKDCTFSEKDKLVLLKKTAPLTIKIGSDRNTSNTRNGKNDYLEPSKLMKENEISCRNSYLKQMDENNTAQSNKPHKFSGKNISASNLKPCQKLPDLTCAECWSFPENNLSSSLPNKNMSITNDHVQTCSPDESIKKWDKVFSSYNTTENLSKFVSKPHICQRRSYSKNINNHKTKSESKTKTRRTRSCKKPGEEVSKTKCKKPDRGEPPCREKTKEEIRCEYDPSSATVRGPEVIPCPAPTEDTSCRSEPYKMSPEEEEELEKAKPKRDCKKPKVLEQRKMCDVLKPEPKETTDCFSKPGRKDKASKIERKEIIVPKCEVKGTSSLEKIKRKIVDQLRKWCGCGEKKPKRMDEKELTTFLNEKCKNKSSLKPASQKPLKEQKATKPDPYKDVQSREKTMKSSEEPKTKQKNLKTEADTCIINDVSGNIGNKGKQNTFKKMKFHCPSFEPIRPAPKSIENPPCEDLELKKEKEIPAEKEIIAVKEEEEKSKHHCKCIWDEQDETAEREGLKEHIEEQMRKYHNRCKERAAKRK